MKKIILLLWLFTTIASKAQIRSKNNRYFELNYGIRDLIQNKNNFGASISFVSATRLKCYKRLNLGYDIFGFNLKQLNKTIPVERYFASYTLEPTLLRGKIQKAYLGFEFGGGIGYESINKGNTNIENFTITNGSSQILGLIIGGINAEKYLSNGLAIGLKGTVYFSPLSNVQKTSFLSSVSMKFKLGNKL